MKLFKLFAALLCVPVLLVATASADDKDKKAPAKATKPSLTYYYFDG